jgi:hypothetical protein
MKIFIKKLLFTLLFIGIGVLCVNYWWIALPTFLILMLPLVIGFFIEDDGDYW